LYHHFALILFFSTLLVAFLETTSSNTLHCSTTIEALMVLARVANFFTNGDSTNNLADGSRRNVASTVQTVELSMEDTRRRAVEEDEVDEDAARPPYLHVRMPNPEN
jgi:hypothetical protein